MNVVILAAGQGTRMHSNLPKVLHLLAGRPLLAHVISAAQSIKAQRIIVVYRSGGEAVRAKFETNPQPSSAPITWVKQEPQSGTGHAVQQAAPFLDDRWPTLILYGDVPLIQQNTLSRLINAADGGLALLTVELDNPTGYGRVIRREGLVSRIVEHRDALPAELAVKEVNVGIMVAGTTQLRKWLGALTPNNAQGEYYLTDVVKLAFDEGCPVAGVQPDHVWETLGVNSRAQLVELERRFQRVNAQKLLAQGVGLMDPERIDVRGDLICGRDVLIDVNCVFEGRVELANGVSIGPNCVLRNVSVAADTQILAFTYAEDSTIGASCRIGPYTRIRPASTIGKEVHLGNFVEVKASQIGLGSKANHHAYIGDTEIGSGVNVGAGTIVCNYDGANKHRTIIEDGAFIGSDCQLVAPVRVGKNATLGAGTTLTKDAPAGKLTITRVRQSTIENWQRPTKKSPSR
ncbi:MAG: UDP-N-acetylglucosamine diphosphorylase/glucosamine-1-phosphate N-acetyltransferase [Betaproteobacteria bacterium]|nr:UDP-N-acetylglucosamine diphosphorylase/glucosamine-1-phosphate N-acetyltransferase [Betaproteobacteria bacterium]